MGQTPSNLIPTFATSRTDLAIASVVFGFTVGFGFLTIWEAIKQTKAARDAWHSLYIWLVWGEIVSVSSFAIVATLMLDEVITEKLWVLIVLLVFWSFKLHCMLQIIINRARVIMPNPYMGTVLKWSVAALFLLINISVFCIWIPARMGVSETFIRLNDIWDRVEKVIYLVVDAGLNWYFVRLVRQRLVKQGSTKYNKLVKFNVRIIFLSLAMDGLVIGTMNLKNSLVYIQFHPLAFMVKLNIEMSMASLIRKIAAEKTRMQVITNNRGYEMTVTAKNEHTSNGESVSENPSHDGPGVMVRKQVIVSSMPIEDAETDHEGSFKSSARDPERNGDESPLRNEWGAPHEVV